MQTSSVTQKGQVTIPASVRKQLGLSTGDAVGFEIEGDRVRLTRAGRLLANEVSLRLH